MHVCMEIQHRLVVKIYVSEKFDVLAAAVASGKAAIRAQRGALPCRAPEEGTLSMMAGASLTDARIYAWSDTYAEAA